MDGTVRTDENADVEDVPEATVDQAVDQATDKAIGKELRMLEAMLFAATEPVTEESLANRLPEGCDLPAMLAELCAQYDGRGINLVAVAGRWAFRTAPDLADMLEIEINVSRKLSRAAVETLAIIAYHQPVTRGDIEEIRGVALSKGTLDVLLEIGWIRPVGRRRTPGRPVTWGTSADFLDHFNLNELADLPGVDEMKAAGLLDTRPVRTIFGEGAIAENVPSEEDETDEEEPIEALDPTDGEAVSQQDDDSQDDSSQDDSSDGAEIVAGSPPVENRLAG